METDRSDIRTVGPALADSAFQTDGYLAPSHQSVTARAPVSVRRAYYEIQYEYYYGHRTVAGRR